MSDLVLSSIRKSFGTVDVIHGVDLTVTDGEFVVFVGPSGCGKSTLLRIIAGLEACTSGDILLDGRRVNDVAAADRGARSGRRDRLNEPLCAPRGPTCRRTGPLP